MSVSWRSHSFLVMAGLDPAIHVLIALTKEDVDARVKPGHDGGGSRSAHALPRSSRNRSSFCCTGRSEKLNSTESTSASWVTHCQLGTTNRSRAPHSKVWSPILVRPLPSIAANTVASVERQ